MHNLDLSAYGMRSGIPPYAPQTMKALHARRGSTKNATAADSGMALALEMICDEL